MRVRLIILSGLLPLSALITRGQSVEKHHVAWQHKEVVTLDSAGIDYSFTGLLRESPGGGVYHAAQIETTHALGETPVISSVEYSPVGFSYTHLPDWLLAEENPRAELHLARGQSVVSVQIPAFRVVGSQLEGLSSYSVSWSRTGRSAGRSVSTSDFVGAMHSHLSTGHWAKIAVHRSGIYRITYEQIRDLGLGDPALLSVWGHDGRQLPYMNGEPCIDDVRQLPLRWYTQTPGVIQAGDYALVYLGGTDWWEYDSHRKMFIRHTHEYSERSHYFITTSEVVENVRDGICNGGMHTQSDFWALAAYSGRNINLAHSGREWFGESFNTSPHRLIGSGLSQHEAGSEARVWIRLAASSMRTSQFDFSVESVGVGHLVFPPIPLSESRIRYANVRETVLHLPSISAGELKLGINFSKPTPSSNGWLSRVVFNVRQPLIWRNETLLFHTDSIAPAGETSQLSIVGLPEGAELWDVSNPFATIRYTSPGLATLPADSRRATILFHPSQTREVDIVGVLPNQNLHAMSTPDLLIVTHRLFRTHAEQIAQIYRTSPLTRLDVSVVDAEEVYNEFSSGNRDVSAIRNLARMHYWRSGGAGGRFRYLLLIGKPLYSMIDLDGTENLLPNWQSLNSWDRAESFGTDDFFGLLDLNEGGATGLMDIGVGRYSVSQPDYADLIVRHEQAYHNPQNWGSWLREGILVADDEDRNIFMQNADSLRRHLNRTRPEILVKPLYADAFAQDNLWYRAEYPSLTAAIGAHINRGVSLFNYIGHANPHQLGHEYFLRSEDADNWRNLNCLPLFIAASCNLAEYDLQQVHSLGERMLFMPQGGAIGLISSSRIAFSLGNFDFNSHLIQAMYPPKDAPPPRALGDALWLGKSRTSGVSNKRKFVLLGNPALPLLNPTAKAHLTAIQGIAPRGLQDTIRAHDKVSLKIGLSTAQGTPFDGDLFITMLGPKQKIQTKANDAESPFVYSDRTTTVFCGSATAKEGVAHVEFIVPTDMDIEYGQGLISLLGVSSQGICAGSYEAFIIGGTRGRSIDDREGPSITLSFNDYAQRNNPVVDANPTLIVQLKDSSGINTTGGGRGHNLRFTLRGEGQQQEVSLNEFYRAKKDSYKEGEARYQFNRLSAGRYTLTVDAWDICNNPSSAKIEFTVIDASAPQVSNLLNYPNPFTDRTAFYFDGTRPGQPTEVLIQIYAVDGTLVKSIRAYEPCPTMRFGPYQWDGKDDWGKSLGRGVYFYRVKLRHHGDWQQEASEAERFEKLLKL